MTVAEAAKHATVSEALIRQWVKEGTLPHFRLGAKGKRGTIKIAVEDLDRVLADSKVGAKGLGAPQVKSSKPAPGKAIFKHLRLT